MSSSASSFAQHHLIVAQCESYLATHGDNHKGVGWPDFKDAQLRYQVMLDGLLAAAPEQPVRVMDFGCGPAHFYEFLQQGPHASRIEYTGLDLSEKYLAIARQKFPAVTFLQLDVLREPDALPPFDYIVLNGIFTQKCSNSFEQMWAYCQETLRILWPKARYGMAFNAMTKHVDWERDDLFHLPMDTLAAFLKQELTRHFTFRHDYGLFEYTTYLFGQPNQR